MATAAFATAPRPMHSPKRLVGCIERSQVAAASDSPSLKSDSYNLSVSEKKRAEYYLAIPQICRALTLARPTGSRAWRLGQFQQSPRTACRSATLLIFEQDAFGCALHRGVARRASPDGFFEAPSRGYRICEDGRSAARVDAWIATAELAVFATRVRLSGAHCLADATKILGQAPTARRTERQQALKIFARRARRALAAPKVW